MKVKLVTWDCHRVMKTNTAKLMIILQNNYCLFANTIDMFYIS